MLNVILLVHHVTSRLLKGVMYLYNKPTKARLLICSITYYVSSSTSFGHSCDYHQGVLYSKNTVSIQIIVQKYDKSYLCYI